MSKTYQKPVLKTYGKLVDLTKGNQGNKEDAGIFKIEETA